MPHGRKSGSLLTLCLPPELLVAIDRRAAAQGLPRTATIRHLLTTHPLLVRELARRLAAGPRTPADVLALPVPPATAPSPRPPENSEVVCLTLATEIRATIDELAAEQACKRKDLLYYLLTTHPELGPLLWAAAPVGP